MSWPRRLVLLALALFLAADLFFMLRMGGGRRLPRAAPDLTVKTLGGGTFHLKDALGHPVLLDFWATWCGPCKESLPQVDQVYRRYRERGLRAVAIEVDGNEAGARVFAGQLGLQLPVGLGDDEASRAYGVSTIPYLVLVDERGQVKRAFQGVHSAADLAEAVEGAGLPR